MLVLTRKRMEKLYIGGDICVTVVRLEGGQVRLGIDAPRHVPVVRAELRRRDNAAAALARFDQEMERGGGPSTVPSADPWSEMKAPPVNRVQPGSEPASDQSRDTRSVSRKR